MEFGQKKFREIDLFDISRVFWPGLFKTFWPTVPPFVPFYLIAEVVGLLSK